MNAVETSTFSPFNSANRDAREVEEVMVSSPDDDFIGEEFEIPNDGYDESDSPKSLFDELKGQEDDEDDDYDSEYDSEGGSYNPNDEESKVSDSGITSEFATFTAKWMVNIYARTFCMWLKEWCKIDKKAIYEAVLNGHLDEKYLEVVEKENQKVEDKIEFTEEQKKFIVEPLSQFVKVKNLKVPSGLQVVIGLAVVSGSVFMKANTIRKDNQFVLQKILRATQMRATQMYNDTTENDTEIQIIDDVDDFDIDASELQSVKKEDDFEYVKPE